MVTFVCVVTTKVTDWAGLNRPALFLNFYRTTVIININQFCIGFEEYCTFNNREEQWFYEGYYRLSLQTS